ncbi:hypothetical protein ABID13_003408 [Enterocloster citroniae]|uniref:Uncharacterized protein n=1 Tax=Enterocloster citroniae TaxID=358743 RepID=A0ABV2G0I9_9FIRM
MNKEWTTKEEGYLEELPVNTGSGKEQGSSVRTTNRICM